MQLNVTAGNQLLIAAAEGVGPGGYFSSINQNDIESKQNLKFNEIKMTPLTSKTGQELSYEKTDTAVPATAKQYMEFTLYFWGSAAMDVYLTVENGPQGNDGTYITSDISDNNSQQAMADECVRISFTSEDVTNTSSVVPIYQQKAENATTTLTKWNTVQPVIGSDTTKTGYSKAKIFTLGTGGGKKKVKVRIWIEGYDKYCVNTPGSSIELAKTNIRLRFEGVETAVTP